MNTFHLLYLNNDIVLAEEAWRFVSQFRRPPQITGDFITLGGVATLRLGRRHQRAEGTMWNVAVGVNSWVVATADGALLDGGAPFATTRRRLVLSLDDFSRAALLREIAAWVKSGTGEDEPRLSVDPRSVLRVRFDRTGAPRRLSGTIRLIDEDSGRIAGRMTVRYRR